MSLNLPTDYSPRRTFRAKPLPDLDALPASALLTRNQVCALSGFALPTLKQWAKQGRGPRITIIEGRPRYLASDVRTWLGCEVA
jgi:predicted DNA-binding transcriptional regulator AlpA